MMTDRRDPIDQSDMRTCAAALALIRRHEGLRLRAYKCPAGVYTIGYGHTVGVRAGDTCTAAQAEAWLSADVGEAEALLAPHAPALTRNQHGALVAWLFNLGAKNWRASTLRRCVQQGQLDQVPAELERWVFAAGVKRVGLYRRRAAEVQLWETPDRVEG